MNTDIDAATLDADLSEVVARLDALERQAGHFALEAMREQDSVQRRQAQVEVDRMTGEIDRLTARRTVLERAKEEMERPERAAARRQKQERVEQGRREMAEAGPALVAAAQRIDDLAAEYAEALIDLEAREAKFRAAFGKTQANGAGRGGGWSGLFQMQSAVALSQGVMASADKPPAFRSRPVADLVRTGISSHLRQAGIE